MFRYILGMSRADKEIRSSLVNKVELLNSHLVKLCLYPDAEEKSHWEDEVFAFLNTVSKRKSSNKYPSQKFILECLQCDNDILDNVIRVVKSKYDYLPQYILNEDIIKKIEQYQVWLASQLSSYGNITKQEALQTLHILGL